MELPLVVGVDGSEPSLRALDWAVDDTARRGVPLRVLYASGWEWHKGHEPSFGVHRGKVRVYSDHIVAQAVERALRRAAAVQVSGEALAEDPAAALVRESRTACAVVVGSRGRGELAGLLLGSVGLSVAAHAEGPVVVVRGDEDHRAAVFGQVAVGVGGPDQATAAVALAFEAAERRGAVLRAVHAWRCPDREVPDFPRAADATDGHQWRAEMQLDEVLRAPMRAHPTVTVRREVVEGRVRTALLNVTTASDLVVLGARRSTGHVGLQLGPFNHALLHHAACPVAVVPHD